MNYADLKGLSAKNYFTVEDLVDLLNIKQSSAWMVCNRNVKNGTFLRLKKNFYVLDQKWVSFGQEDFFKIANFLQVPSYVSFMTVLSVYGVTTQVQRDFFESASLKRSVQFDIRGTVFNFYKLNKKYYFDFIKKDNIFMATKEKAFVDMVYLYSFGKYKMDLASIDFNKLDKKRVRKISEVFPLKTKNILKKLCRI